ncbi:dTMP kinase [Tessaracoccus sp. ZS01]|uniref:dTMP kinase n=1 Tax=Tessaracoccus sp. ZS01 TaxID=1906324 RepID=UPI00096CD9E1|nr:dTMP kinase [Tessaracoccus sp. ZS01]MCG6568240.1 dTMP kinase [Tessaracoccus sp. ZS01]OMG53481.1 dTMP kinase [Tessaracoccus sp. ZS01]
MSGLFIVFEGGDRVGKSTQVRRLQSWLMTRGLPHIVTREPGGTELGATLRRLVLDPASGDVDHRAEALMYAADKAQHVHEVIRPALERGEVVVCDRYVDSMIAYQGAGRDLALGEVADIAWWAVGGLRPDLTILLDANPDDAVSIKQDKDRLESAGLEFHRRVRRHFLALAAERPEEYFVMKALEGRDLMAAKIAGRIESLLAG